MSNRIHPDYLLGGLSGAAANVASAVSRIGVRRDLFDGRVRAFDHFKLARLPSDQIVVLFASSGLHGQLGVITDSGIVIEIQPADKVNYVNRSFMEFDMSVSEVLALGDLYKKDADPAAFERASVAVRSIISSIDPNALAEDSFWSTVVDDIEMGDFWTES